MLNIESNTETFSLHAGAFGEFYNARLLKQNGIEDTPAKREEILNLHIKRHELFEQCRNTATVERERLREIQEQLTALEFQLQEAWGFKLSEDFHSYWYQLPKCTCPKMDNQDSFGSGRKDIDLSCPIHGN